jgi:hypothetical protein
MIHTIDKKIIENRIAFLKEQEQIWRNMNTKSDSITADNIGLMISENELILSKIEELEVVDGDRVQDGYARAHPYTSFSQYLTDNNYLIVKTK